MKEKKGVAVGAVLLAAVFVVLAAAGVYYYARIYKPHIDNVVQESTKYSAGGRQPQKSGERTLVAENENVSIYRDGDFVIIVNGDKETEFSGWSENFGSIKTQINFADMDDNGTEDIIILDEEGQDDISFNKLYGLYVLTTEQNTDSGYQVYYTNADKWLSYFNETVTCYLNQPKSHPDMLQFVMDLNGVEVLFNTETGLALPEFRAWYTRALVNSNNDVVDLSSIRLSPAFISFDSETNSVEMTIYVYAVYKNTREQNVGTISGGFAVVDGVLSYADESVTFTPNPQLAIPAPEDRG